MKKPIVIFGGGGHAKVVFDVIAFENKYEVVGIVDSKFPLGSLWLDKIKVISYEEAFKINCGITAIGDNFIRKKIVDEIILKSFDFDFITTIHPSAVIGSQVKIGKGVSIMAKVVINTFAEICDHVIVNTGAIVEHDCYLDSFVFMAPGSVIGGNVKVGELAMIGMNASVRQGLSVGNKTIIGMGAVLVQDALGDALYFGCPARNVKN